MITNQYRCCSHCFVICVGSMFSVLILRTSRCGPSALLFPPLAFRAMATAAPVLAGLHSENQQMLLDNIFVLLEFNREDSTGPLIGATIALGPRDCLYVGSPSSRNREMEHLLTFHHFAPWGLFPRHVAVMKTWHIAMGELT